MLVPAQVALYLLSRNWHKPNIVQLHKGSCSFLSPGILVRNGRTKTGLTQPDSSEVLAAMWHWRGIRRQGNFNVDRPTLSRRQLYTRFVVLVVGGQQYLSSECAV